MKIDTTDKKILNILLDKGRLSLREIAKKAGVSVVTVLKRVKLLEKEKVIKGYSAEIDYEKLSYDIEVLIRMKISQGKLFQVQKKIANHPNVFAVYDITGRFDSIIIARFKSKKAMDTFLKKIQTYDFVEGTETSLILNTLKEKQIFVD